jgi:hypothetical protein
MTLAKAPWLPPDCNRDFSATMGLSDTAARPVRGLWLLLGGCPGLAAGRLCRVSQVPGGSVCARCLLSPRRVRLLHLVGASEPMLASPILAGWPLSFKFNEAESSSRDTTARAFAAPGFVRQDCSRQPQSWLHDSRPFIMMNTFSSLEPPSFLGAPESTECSESRAENYSVHSVHSVYKVAFYAGAIYM